MKTISPHAKTLLALLNNAKELCCVHHEYVMARDVMRAMQKVGKSLGFELDNDFLRYMLSGIGAKNPVAMREDFDKFAAIIGRIDKKLDKAPLAGDKKNVR